MRPQSLHHVFLAFTFSNLVTSDKGASSGGQGVAYTYCDRRDYTGTCSTFRPYEDSFTVCRTVPQDTWSLTSTIGVWCWVYRDTGCGKEGRTLLAAQENRVLASAAQGYKAWKCENVNGD
jgi:hypothetical protein